MMLVPILPGLLFGEKDVAVSSSAVEAPPIFVVDEAMAESARGREKTGRKEAEQKLMDAWEGTTDPGAIPMAGISFPVSHHDDGSVQLQFKAEKALLPSLDSEYIRATGITLELFAPSGILTGAFHGERGLYDRATRIGFCEGPVLIANKDVRIDGTNMIWDLESQRARIPKSARVIIRAGMMKGVGKAFQ